ncbi:MAG TPA: tetratricopeptide repeat protein [Gemmatimonadales bacterium]|nr:tetratricopeptide repeat protein [Gemmatimonadales bacterium]
MKHLHFFPTLRILPAACGALLLLVARPAPAAAQDIVAPDRLEVLQARLAQDTNDPVAYYNLALGYWSKKKYDLADSTLRIAVAMNPELALPHLAIALVQLRNKDHWRDLKRHGGDTAVAQEVRYREREYVHAFMIDPFLDVKALGLFKVSYQQAFADLSFRINYWMMRTGDPLDSMPSFYVWLHSIAAARINRLPDAVTDIQALARASRARDRWDSVSAAPLVTSNYFYMLAALLQRLGYRYDAMRLYEEVLSNDIGNYEAHVQLARIYEGQNDWPHAVEQRRAAVTVFPENHVLVMDLGVTQFHAGALADAEESLHQAVEAGPRDAQVYYWLGTVQQARGETDGERDSFGRFLSLAPGRDSLEISEVRQKLAALH